MVRGRELAAAILAAFAIAFVVLTGCATPPEATSPPETVPPARTRSVDEDRSMHDAMWAHAQKVWPRTQERLTLGMQGEMLESLPATVAAVSHMTQPQAVWAIGEEAGSGSPWDRLREKPFHQYFIPVVDGSGRPVATLKGRLQGEKWAVWPSRNYVEMAEGARVKLDAYFGSAEYEWRFVENSGIWVFARSGSRVAAVVIEPWG